MSNTRGHGKPSIHAVVPGAPDVPGEQQAAGIDREDFEERAAIIEFDGGLSREEAETLARKEAAPADSHAPAHHWRLHFPDQSPLEVFLSPAAACAEVLTIYPGAVVAERCEPGPVAEEPLSMEVTAIIQAWLARLGENDLQAAADLIELCRRDSEARRYVLARCAGRLSGSQGPG